MVKNAVLYCVGCGAAGPTECLPHQSLMLRQGHMWEKQWDPEIWDGNTGEAANFQLPNSTGPLAF